MTGRILPPVSAILPLWLVRSMVGWRETLAVWPALAVSGLSFAFAQFYWSNYQENGLVDVVAALVSLLAMVAFLKVWRPKVILGHDPAGTGTPSELPHHSAFAVLRGWSPFLLASLLIFVATQPAVVKALTIPALKRPMPGLHRAVVRVPPVVPTPTPEDAFLDLNLIALPGTAVLTGGILAALGLGLSPARIARIFGRTVVRMTPSLLAISFMVGLAFVTRYSGMDTVLGLSLTRTGAGFPFFGTLLGWLGAALTGTDAGSNALFGNLQKVTAERLGLPPILMASANSAGGVMGKMIDAQSIVVAGAATGQVGNEAAIFRAVLKHSLALVAIVGLIVAAFAHLAPGWIPDASGP
jgi:lactate permease